MIMVTFLQRCLNAKEKESRRILYKEMEEESESVNWEYWGIERNSGFGRAMGWRQLQGVWAPSFFTFSTLSPLIDDLNLPL